MLGAFRKSLASFNPTALFLGVDHIAPAVTHMADATTSAPRSNNALERAYSMVCGPNDVQWDGGKIVVLVPLRAQEEGLICSPGLERRERRTSFGNVSLFFNMHSVPQGAKMISFQNGNGQFGQSKR